MIRSQILKRKLVPSSSPFTLVRSPLACAAPFLACLGAAPALALFPVTFVSGKGIDSGNCADPAHPCHRFDFAIGQTSAGGEIKALDPANYGGVEIKKSISITGVDGAGIDRAAGPVAITINAGANDVVNLSHLTLEGLKLAQTGILLNSGGSLTVTHCTVRNFIGTGIALRPTVAAKFRIGDTLVSDNGENGIFVFPQAGGSAQATLDHVLATRNTEGIAVNGRATTGIVDVLVVDSVAANNFSAGFEVNNRGFLRLAHSAATGNPFGVVVGAGIIAESFGDNAIHGNSLNDVSGNLRLVLKQ